MALMTFSLVPTAHAYGKENWQIGFAGTGVFPNSIFGNFGFWGWCTFGGGVASGNNGDCEFAEYFHIPGVFTGTCHESLDISSWVGTGGTFVISGTATVVPASETAFCLSFFPGSATFSGVDTGIPSTAGHFNFGPLGVVGQFVIQVTQIS